MCGAEQTLQTHTWHGSHLWHKSVLITQTTLLAPWPQSTTTPSIFPCARMFMTDVWAMRVAGTLNTSNIICQNRMKDPFFFCKMVVCVIQLAAGTGIEKKLYITLPQLENDTESITSLILARLVLEFKLSESRTGNSYLTKNKNRRQRTK